MEAPYIFNISDQAVTLSLGNTIGQKENQKILAMMQWLTEHSFPGLLDIIPAYSSITIVYDAFLVTTQNGTTDGFRFVRQQLSEAYHFSNARVENLPQRMKRIPVCYEDPFSPDLHEVASVKGIRVDEVVTYHTGKIYQVYMLGFLPGFPYMAELDEHIAVPRKKIPRTRVEQGSVGLAGTQTGIYPVASPGGWQIIGKTPLILFDHHRQPPVLFEPGDQVQFYSVTRTEFEDLLHTV
jgi:inhibitor of KinA